MGRLRPPWRRYWDARPGELAPSLQVIGHGHEKREPVSGPRGRRRVATTTVRRMPAAAPDVPAAPR